MTRVVFLAVALVSVARPAGAAVVLTPQEQLGKALFFDASLSRNRNQSCASCHDPAVGFTGATSAVNAHGAVYAGSVPTRFGNRKPPAAAYAGDSPRLGRDSSGAWSGGMFWDGRAEGKVLGDPLAEQAMGPFLNPLEQALASAEELRSRVKASGYAALFDLVWGFGALDGPAQGVYERIGLSIAAYERSLEVSAYTSKFDLFWQKARSRKLDVGSIGAGNWTRFRSLGLSDAELYGLAVFNDPSRANCASCHSLAPGSKGYPLFTNHAFHNLGWPRNPENPFYANLAYNPQGTQWIDEGLGGFLDEPGERGKVKVPTLRNVDKRPSSTFVKAYGHNGAFKSLEEVVGFYRMRATGGGCGCAGAGGRMGGTGGGMGGMGAMTLPPPEVDENLATLFPFGGMDQSYLVAFLKTLSDGYFQR
ncbi:MAG: cytochrome c peroxidase [Myxococcales bacterium]